MGATTQLHNSNVTCTRGPRFTQIYDCDNTYDFKLFYNEYWVEKSIDPASMFIPITQITFNVLVMTCMDCSLKYMIQPWLM